jgi:phosphotransacetylase
VSSVFFMCLPDEVVIEGDCLINLRDSVLSR